jgi:hypothetical protein
VPTREIRTSVVTDGTRSELWELLTTVSGLTSCVAPGADVHAIEGGHWLLAFDGRGERAEDGGTILKYAREQELIVAFRAPALLPALDRAVIRLTLAIEPLAPARQRLVLFQTDFGEGEDWDRLLAHLTEAWEPVLERIRRRMLLVAPTIETYDPFWAGI